MSWFALHKYYKAASDVVVTGYSPYATLYASLLQANGMRVTLVHDPTYAAAARSDPLAFHNRVLARGATLAAPIMQYPHACGWGDYYSTVAPQFPWYRLTTRRPDGSAFVVASHSLDQMKSINENAGYYGVKIRNLTSFSDRILANYAGTLRVFPNFGKIDLIGESATTPNKVVVRGSRDGTLVEADIVIDCSVNTKRPRIFGRDLRNDTHLYVDNSAEQITSSSTPIPDNESKEHAVSTQTSEPLSINDTVKQNGFATIPLSCNTILNNEPSAGVRCLSGQSLIQTVSLGHREYYADGVKLRLFPIIPSVLDKNTLFQWELLYADADSKSPSADLSTRIINNDEMKKQLLSKFESKIPRELMYVLKQTQTELTDEPVFASKSNSALAALVEKLDEDFPRYAKVGPDNFAISQFSDFEFSLTMFEMFEIVKGILRRRPEDLVEVIPAIRTQIAKIRSIGVPSTLPSSTDNLIMSGKLDAAGWMLAFKAMKNQSGLLTEQRIQKAITVN